MRATRTWGLIRAGETFEALATTIIFFEDSGARLFGRRGHDGGQDARSGDGKTVYQAKHHVSPTAAKAIADAKREASKIRECRQVGDPRYAHWVGVINWVLVTNAGFNPRDEETWSTEVVPLFSALGLTATYWEEATLDGYLDKHPEVDRAFFQNENRVFLSPPEARLRVADDDLFTLRNDLAPYVGRESDHAALETFLTGDKNFLQVHAAGGIGKTRFLLECACDIAAKGDWQVLWANVQSMEASSTWFDAVVPERPTLLMVDDPDDERLVQRLQEQLGRRVGRAQEWKIAIAIRSANDPILKALQHPRMKRWVEELLLEPLKLPECEEMCLRLLESGKLANADQSWRRETAKMLARRFDGYPIWLTLAIHLLEEDGSLAKLPVTARDLCCLYLDEALKVGQADERLPQLMRWVALLGPINREDETQLKDLAERVKCAGLQQVREALQKLVSARLLRKWGARDRLADVKPDVLRDFILSNWFCEERDYGESRYAPSEDAKNLIGQLTKCLIDGTTGEREKRVLVALARTDFLLRYGDNPAHLGTSLFATVDSALAGMTPLQRISLIEKLEDVGPYYPNETLQILRRLRLEPATEQTVNNNWVSRTLSQNDVLLELAHAHHRIAHGILTDAQCTLILEELYALVIDEHRIGPTLKYGLPNDGKRADNAIRNLLENGPSFCREFGDAAAQVALRVLNTSNPLGADTLKAVHAIVKPLCDVQRHQSWSEGSTIRMRTQLLHPTHSNMEGRRKVLARLRAILEHEFEAIDDIAKALLWDMLSKAHQQVNYAKGQSVDGHEQALGELHEWLLEDLGWVKNLLTQRVSSPRELRSARQIWHWHAEHEPEEELITLAKELENLYLSHPTVQLFENLTDWSEAEDTQQRIELMAEELAIAGAASIGGFLAEALEFLGDQEVRRVFSVASSLGRLAISHQSVRAFVTDGLRMYARESSSYQFVVSGVNSWVFSQRSHFPADTAQLVEELLSHCTLEKKLDLLRMLYGAHYRHEEALLNSRAECDLVRSKKRLFVEANAIGDYIACTLWGLRHDWTGLKADIEDVLDAASREQRADAMRTLVERVHQVIDAAGDWNVPEDLLIWFWHQLVGTPDLDSVEYDKRWYVEQVLKALGKVPTGLLVDAVRRRAALHEEIGDLGFDAPSKLVPLVDLVGPDNVCAPEIQDAVGELVTLLTESSLMEHWLPKLLARIDPQGLEVPPRLAMLITAAVDAARVRILSRAACYYTVGTPGWRQIARAAFQASQPFSPDEREHIYYSLSETGRRSWSRAPGTVAKIFTDAVETAKRSLAEESEKDFLHFWQWRLRNAQVELRHEEEKLKEEVWD